jgi:3-deoxy-D-manno-octulosonate 8-phosphate phosphatase (KDO 8-P phosphatase)
MISYKQKLNHITTFIFDVDGVLTNGDVLLINGDIVRSLNSRDAYSLQYAAKLNYRIFIITGGHSQDVKERLLGLGVIEVHLSSSDKLAVYEQIKRDYQLSDAEILYMGDDIPDLPVMKQVGVATCPQDAAVELKAMAHYVSPHIGGRHCVRDVVEQTLRVQQNWLKEEAFKW